MEWNLNRFHEAQAEAYPWALAEIRAGKKQSHWIWYIFPQISGLGESFMSKYYAIANEEEARAYWADPVLSVRLKEISGELLALDKPIESIMGFPDNWKLRSCMTLFYYVSREPVFQEVLDKFFDGKQDERTLHMLEELPW